LGNVGQTPSLYDTLGWLVTANANQTLGHWWVYERYADQTGRADQRHAEQRDRRRRVPGSGGPQVDHAAG